MSILSLRTFAATIGIGLFTGSVFLLGSLQSALAGSAVTGTDYVKTHIAASSKYLDSFDQSQSLNDLRSAVDELGFAANVHAMTAESFLSDRRGLVAGWARVFKTIERSYDPAFNPIAPENQVQFGLPDPATIADPAARQAASAAITRNAENAKNYERYHQLLDIDQQAMATFDLSLRHLQDARPRGASRDSEALDAILRQANISDERRKLLDAAIAHHPSP